MPVAGCMLQCHPVGHRGTLAVYCKSVLMLSVHRVTLLTDLCVDGIALPCGTLQISAGKAMVEL